MKRYSPSFTIMEMNRKPQAQHLVPVGVARFQNSVSADPLARTGSHRLSQSLVGYNMVQPLQKTGWWFLTKLNTLTRGPSVEFWVFTLQI